MLQKLLLALQQQNKVAILLLLAITFFYPYSFKINISQQFSSSKELHASAPLEPNLKTFRTAPNSKICRRLRNLQNFGQITFNYNFNNYLQNYQFTACNERAHPH